ncbi:ferrous iron transport protein B [Hydrogenimonas urashimensis]|uniref:ferrous iron transport protein B n=1 Tax=Hydrogenimonas urashimensis TaxID=2740515 RepID=UPI001915EDC2|nr:ferrous iron transport protein B [Hydrogenimonas urashimensis]
MISLAFVGNPNTGKTALINAIAGSDLEVGNWPGVTVEKKEARFLYEKEEVSLVDLPGTYTLSPYSMEEKITRDTLALGKIDGIIDVIDTTNLSRNLYLTLELVDMQKPMVLALNMFDDFTRRGYALDIGKLEKILGVDAVATIASKGVGAKRVIASAVKAVKEKRVPRIQPYQEHIEKEIAFLQKRLAQYPDVPYPPRLFSIKLIEGDEFAIQRAKRAGAGDILDFAKEARGRLERHMKLPIKTIVTRARYEVIDRILDEVLTKPMVDKVVLSERIDNIVLNRYAAIPVFLLTMYLMFKFTFDGSAPLVEWMGGFFDGYVGKYLRFWMEGFAPPWAVSLVTEGLVGGVGLVLSFLPLLFFLYFFMALLEESGYMARVSFLLDKLASKLGIKGNAFISLIVGFGCNVPAVYSTRALTSRRERIVTMLMIPLMSCSARLPIYALFTALFFASHQALVIMSLYGLGVALALLIAFIADKLLPVSGEKPFLLELPTYHMPTMRAVWALMKPKLADFIVRAGTLIVAASIALWAIVNLPSGTEPQNSYLAKAAKSVTPIFKPAGFGDHWEPVAALIPGTLAKEVVIGSLGTIYGVETASRTDRPQRYDFVSDTFEELRRLKNALIDAALHLGNIRIETLHTDGQSTPLKSKLKAHFPSPLNAYSYMVFVLLYIPCVSTMAAIKHEFGWRWLLFEVLFLPFLAYGISVAIYQAGTIFTS